MSSRKTFLTAEWRNLVMLNYEVDPAILAARVPEGCELDAWQGRTFVSMVGFLFLRTRVLGLPIPFHRNFEEVNLRFYVRHKAEGEWRRGVVFVRELVPRWAIAAVARGVYGEKYASLPMRHSIQAAAGSGSKVVSYQWRRGGVWEGLSATYSGTPELPSEEAEETFITEHYWGYAQHRGATVEYQVEHPRWRVCRAETCTFECDVEALYGPEFRTFLSTPPSSAFVADGSPVLVRRGRPLT
jgi:uncharacterized protein YqjF (DUF2071 family)